MFAFFAIPAWQNWRKRYVNNASNFAISFWNTHFDFGNVFVHVIVKTFPQHFDNFANAFHWKAFSFLCFFHFRFPLFRMIFFIGSAFCIRACHRHRLHYMARFAVSVAPCWKGKREISLHNTVCFPARFASQSVLASSAVLCSALHFCIASWHRGLLAFPCHAYGFRSYPSTIGILLPSVLDSPYKMHLSWYTVFAVLWFGLCCFPSCDTSLLCLRLTYQLSAWYHTNDVMSMGKLWTFC